MQPTATSQETFREVADRAERAGVDVEHQIIDGRDTSTGAARLRARARLSICSSCGHHHSRRAGRLLLRGVTQQLLAEATIPVLVVSDEAP